MYPFCEIGDVQALNSHRPTYATTSKPTLIQIEGFVDEIAAKLRSVCDEAGYDVTNFHEVSDIVALAIVAGSNKQVVVVDGSQFALADQILITGLASGVRKWEIDTIKAISLNTLTITTVDNSYDAGTVTIYVLNDALRILRGINALGASAMAEEAAFAGISPNKSDHAETLWARFRGSKETRDGLWAINNIEGFLRGATLTTEAIDRATIKSYGSEHSDDEDVEPTFEIGMDF